MSHGNRAGKGRKEDILIFSGAVVNLSNECDLIGIPSLFNGTHQLHIYKVRKRY